MRRRISKVRRYKVYDRCNWICGLCKQPVNPDLSVPDLMAPTLDHIIPLIAGGHHEESNLQLAHFRCNSIKGDGLGPGGTHSGGYQPNRNPYADKQLIEWLQPTLV
jgi:5-methylcytosine-specific restriction endonuclease McrA